MAVIVLYTGNILIAFREELVIVQVTGVAGDAVVVAHVDSLCHLFAGYQCLIQFLAVARADGLHLRLTVFRINLRVCFLQGLRQYIQGGGRSLLHEQVTVMSVLKRIDYQIHGIVQRHHEAGHVRIRYRNGPAVLYLLHPQGNYRTAACHHIAVTGTADGCTGFLTQRTALGYGNLLHHGFADTHGIDGIGGLVGRKHHHILYTMRYGGFQYIVRTDHIGLHSLQRKELATGNLFQGGGGKHIIHSHHGTVHRLAVTDITNVEFYFGILQVMTHVILLFLVTTKNTDLFDITIKKATKNSITKGACSTGNK